jgi:hypothetical protein
MLCSKKIILAVIIAFLGIILLSNLPIKVMAHKKVEIGSVASMKSCESNNPRATQVDGICFETLVPKAIVVIPKYGEETSIKFGVRITNQTSTPYRFDLPFILPKMLNPDVEPMQSSGGQNATRLVEESDIPQIKSGESLDFLMDAKLEWSRENYLGLQGNAGYGGIWIFWCLKPGKYQIRFIYQNQLASKKKFTSKEGRTEIDGFWVGEIQTPFVDLHIR